MEKRVQKEKERVLLATIHPGLHRASMDQFIDACQGQGVYIGGQTWKVVNAWSERKDGEESGKVYGRLALMD